MLKSRGYKSNIVKIGTRLFVFTLKICPELKNKIMTANHKVIILIVFNFIYIYHISTYYFSNMSSITNGNYI